MRENKVAFLKALVALVLVACAAFFAVSALGDPGSGEVVSASGRSGMGGNVNGAWAGLKNVSPAWHKLAAHIIRLSPAWEITLDAEAFLEEQGGRQIGRASCRERVLIQV